MARLEVEVRPGGGVFGYSLFVDGVPVTMGEGRRGGVRCEGRCGDGSSHALIYSFSGASAASLTIVLRCGGRELCRIAATPIGADGARSAGRHIFDL